jgi:hypothetical protein
MIGDHYDPTAARATLLVRTVDGILGTHSVKQAIDAGLIKARREGTELRLYPGEGRS